MPAIHCRRAAPVREHRPPARRAARPAARGSRRSGRRSARSATRSRSRPPRTRSIAAGGTVLKKQNFSTKSSKRCTRSTPTTPPMSPPATAHAIVAEHVVHERVDVARVHREVVDVVGREIAVAVPAEVGDDDLEAGGRERRDVAPPDALGLRDSRAAGAAGNRRRLRARTRARGRRAPPSGAIGELARRRRRRLRRTEPRVVRHISTSRRRRVSTSVLIRHSPSTSS